MSLLNSTIPEFSATAYVGGDFAPVTDADLVGKI
jgi:hypothetical protein